MRSLSRGLFLSLQSHTFLHRGSFSPPPLRSAGVAYASQVLKPDLIVDMATLTGAQLVATGKRHAGVVANTEAVELAAVAAGKRSGDLVHPLPYCPEAYRGEFLSKVADMKNSVKDRSNAQSSCAAIFIAEHLAADYTGGWLHVDMAGPAWVRGGGRLLSLPVDVFLASTLLALARPYHRHVTVAISTPAADPLPRRVTRSVRSLRTGGPGDRLRRGSPAEPAQPAAPGRDPLMPRPPIAEKAERAWRDERAAARRSTNRETMGRSSSAAVGSGAGAWAALTRTRR